MVWSCITLVKTKLCRGNVCVSGDLLISDDGVFNGLWSIDCTHCHKASVFNSLSKCLNSCSEIEYDRKLDFFITNLLLRGNEQYDVLVNCLTNIYYLARTCRRLYKMTKQPIVFSWPISKTHLYHFNFRSYVVVWCRQIFTSVNKVTLE